MKIIQKNIDEIVPYAKNAKKDIQIDKKTEGVKMDIHIRSDELCERCRYGACGLKCKGDKCELDRGMLCACDEIAMGTPCEYFKGKQEEEG